MKQASSSSPSPRISPRRFHQWILFFGFVSGSVATLLLHKLVSSTTADEWNDLPYTYGGTIPQEIVEFEWQPRVVIATKIHDGAYHFRHLQQMLCLLTKAYNHRLNYDIVVFATLPMEEGQIEEIRQIVAPANFTVVIDNPGLKKMVSNYTETQRNNLLERCGVATVGELNWNLKCVEGGGKDPMKYNWQAEFRTLHVWTHPAMESYRWMLWMDADGFATRTWTRDPVAMTIKNNLAIFFAHFPGGGAVGKDFNQRFIQSFGQQICRIHVVNGMLHARMKKHCGTPKIMQIHGFFHISDLDFYRSEPVQKWLHILIGNETRIRRRYDDQIAVTVPAAVLAPNRSWEMEYHGFRPEVYHNHFLDGKYPIVPKGFHDQFWLTNGSTSFPEAYGKCNITAWG
jgi:hypothetical protein